MRTMGASMVKRCGLAVLLPLLMFQSKTLAQATCEVVRDQVDEFTGVHVLHLRMNGLENGPGFEWVVEDERICLRMEWTRKGNEPAVALEGDPLMLKLESDEVMILFSRETTIGRTRTGDDGEVVSIGTYCYWVDEAQLEAIGQEWVQKMRLHFHDGYEDLETTGIPQWQMAFWRSANCLRHELDLKPMPEVISSFGVSGEREN